MSTFAITTLCTVAGMAITALFSYMAFHRNTKKDSEEEGKNLGVIMSELGYIKISTDDIKRENRDTATKLGGLSERITRCEESCKQAHHRIDELKGGD